MVLPFDFLVRGTPISLQGNSSARRNWKDAVHEQASKTWVGNPYKEESLHFTLVHLCDEIGEYPDIDNIIKPIQDALIGLIYDDDGSIISVDAHRRSFLGTFDIIRCPRLFIEGVGLRTECVYVRIAQAKSLEDYL